MADEHQQYRRRERARYFWTKAPEAEETAARTKNPEAKDEFLRVAGGWRDMAAETERHG